VKPDLFDDYIKEMQTSRMEFDSFQYVPKLPQGAFAFNITYRKTFA